MIRSTVLAALFLALAAPAVAQDGWRTVAPENLLVVDTSKGRVLVELEPRAAPLAVERIRTLADRGFYDGLTFHRVLPGFMAQTGDPLGTGAGGSDLPDIRGEFTFRRGREAPLAAVPNAGYGLAGFVGSLPVASQPDAQMMITADQKVGAAGLFCPGVMGMARSGSPDSANSQFFFMTAKNDRLNGQYTPFGRVLQGLDVIESLKAGADADDGRVASGADTMTTVRTAAALPQAQRPSVRVAEAGSAPFEAAVTAARVRPGFDICALSPVVEVQ